MTPSVLAALHDAVAACEPAPRPRSIPRPAAPVTEILISIPLWVAREAHAALVVCADASGAAAARRLNDPSASTEERARLCNAASSKAAARDLVGAALEEGYATRRQRSMVGREVAS